MKKDTSHWTIFPDFCCLTLVDYIILQGLFSKYYLSYNLRCVPLTQNSHSGTVGVGRRSWSVHCVGRWTGSLGLGQFSVNIPSFFICPGPCLHSGHGQSSWLTWALDVAFHGLLNSNFSSGDKDQWLPNLILLIFFIFHPVKTAKIVYSLLTCPYAFLLRGIKPSPLQLDLSPPVGIVWWTLWSMHPFLQERSHPRHLQINESDTCLFPYISRLGLWLYSNLVADEILFHSAFSWI